MSIEKAINFIEKAQLREALETLKKLPFEDQNRTLLTSLSAQLSSLEREKNMGLLTFETEQVRRSQITAALLNLCSDLQKNAPLESPAPPKPPVDPPPIEPKNGQNAGETPPNSPVPSKWPFFFAVVAFAVLFAITLFRLEWTSQNNALFKTLLALAAGGIAASLPGFLNLEWGTAVKAGGALAAFALVYFFNPSSESKPISLRVFVEKKNRGWPDLRFSSESTVKIFLPSGPKTAKLLDGQAEFPGVSHDDLASPFRVRLENSEPFAADSTVNLKGHFQVHLLAKAVGLDRFSGQVFDEKNRPVAGAVFTLEGIFDTSDVRGLFDFSIPEARQKDRYRLLGTKPSHADFDNFVNPSRDILRVSMPSKTKK